MFLTWWIRWTQHRAAEVVEPRLAAIEKAYLERDFETFGRITMQVRGTEVSWVSFLVLSTCVCVVQDSNQFHATCLDTFPPVFYMNDVSKRIIGFVHRMNKTAGRMLVRPWAGCVCFCFCFFVQHNTNALCTGGIHL